MVRIDDYHSLNQKILIGQHREAALLIVRLAVSRNILVAKAVQKAGGSSQSRRSFVTAQMQASTQRRWLA